MLVLGACAHRVPESRPVLPFVTFEATPTCGEVRVVPAMRLHDPLEPELGSFFGPALPAGPAASRLARTEELEDLTAAVGLALPGEVNGELGDRWMGQFRSHRMPGGARQQLEDALRGHRDLDAALAEADCTVLVTNHRDYDAARLAAQTAAFVNTRGPQPGAAPEAEAHGDGALRAVAS